MSSIRISATFIITTIASLSLLTFVPSCVTSNDSSQLEEKMKAIRQIFPSAIEITELQISQEVRNTGLPDNAKVSEIIGPSGFLGYFYALRVLVTFASNSPQACICSILDSTIDWNTFCISPLTNLGKSTFLTNSRVSACSTPSWKSSPAKPGSSLSDANSLSFFGVCANIQNPHLRIKNASRRLMVWC